MLARVLRLFSMAVTVSSLTAPAVLSAQAPADPVVYYACHVPLLGVVYRIKAPGLPSACVSKYHIEFSWNQLGPKGDKGDRGEKGDAGAPGTFNLAGQECPMNYFVTGFNATGGLICRNAAWQQPPEPPPPPPPPPPPSPYDGVWSISPALPAECSGFTGAILESFFGDFKGFDLRRTALEAVTVTPRVGGVLGGLLAQPIELPYNGTLFSTIDVATSEPVSLSNAHGTLDLSLSGTFAGTSSFTGSVTVRYVGSPADCRLGPATFTATKSAP